MLYQAKRRSDGISVSFHLVHLEYPHPIQTRLFVRVLFVRLLSTKPTRGCVVLVFASLWGSKSSPRAWWVSGGEIVINSRNYFNELNRARFGNPRCE